MPASNIQKRKTRARILQAAYALFMAHGYEDTPVDAIAHEAGISRKTLFNYFPSKSQVLWEIARSWYEQSPPLADPALSGNTALQAVRAIFLQQLDLLEAHRPFMQMVLKHSNGMDLDQALREDGQAPADRCLAEATTLFRLAAERGELRAGVSAEAAFRAFAALRNLMMQRCLLSASPDAKSLKAEAEALLDVFFSGCAGQPPRPDLSTI